MSANPPLYGIAGDFSLKKFGGPTKLVENPLVSIVGTTSVQLLQNAPDRISWYIVNHGTSIVEFGFTQGVVFGLAFPIDSNGGMVTADIDDDGELVTYPVFAISAQPGNRVYVVEVRRV